MSRQTPIWLWAVTVDIVKAKATRESAMITVQNLAFRIRNQQSRDKGCVFEIINNIKDALRVKHARASGPIIIVKVTSKLQSPNFRGFCNFQRVHLGRFHTSYFHTVCRSLMGLREGDRKNPVYSFKRYQVRLSHDHASRGRW
jgi:hypothetical protein